MKKFLLAASLITITNVVDAQCFDNEPNYSQFAPKGDGKYKNEILWLGWGNGAKSLKKNDYSNAMLKISEDKYVCVKTVVTSVSADNHLKVDKVDAAWSLMDEYYTNDDDNIYYILKNGVNNTPVKASFKSYAFISTKQVNNTYVKVPIKIKGLVFADAESANTTEYLSLQAKGQWNIVEIMRRSSSNVKYSVKKTPATAAGISQIVMGYGNNSKYAALSMLKFDESRAYANANENFAVTYDAELRGEGTTSVAIGLLTPYADFGDAPESYGAPMHLIEDLELVRDNLSESNNLKEIGNSNSFTAGSLVQPKFNYIGSLGPDANITNIFTDDALGDDYTYYSDGSRNQLSNEENGWPAKYQSLSYKTINGVNYPIGGSISPEIPVVTNKRSVLAGWIDFNLNGKFDDNEMSYIDIPANTNVSVQLQWHIPLDRVAKSTFVRLRLFDFADVNENGTINPALISPISDVYGGEVEDHKMRILPYAVSNPMLINATQGIKTE